MYKFSKTIATAAVLICGVACHRYLTTEGQINIADYKKSSCAAPQEEQIRIVNADFSQGNYGWGMGSEYKVEPSAGVNGNAGLFYERKNPDSYQLCSSGPIPVKAGKRYKYGVWVRGESLHHEGESLSCIAVDLFKNGKFIGGSYPAHFPKTDWSYVEGEFLADQNCEAKLVLYMGRGATGRLWFDDVNIQCAEIKNWMIHLLYPKMSLLFADNPTVSFKVAEFGNERSGVTVYAELKAKAGIASKTSGVTDKNGMVDLNFGKTLTPGEAVISVKVLDIPEKEILAEKEIPVRIEASKPASVIDKQGNLIIDGKAFMPTGLYMHGVSREDVKRLSGTSFNCVMPYGSIYLKFKDSKKEGLDAIREVLDELHKNNIKIIFSLKDIYDGFPSPDKVWKLFGANSADESVKLIVNTFKDHPALLAWYTGDEISHNGIDRLEKRRKLINTLDMKHPTWTVYCSYGDLPLFASTGDVIGVDPYPVKKGMHDMAPIKVAMNAANRTNGTSKGAAVWGVPQFFNWANYNHKGKSDREYRLKNFVDPTENEMLSMCLIMLIKGAKGIVGYSYFDLFSRGAEPDSAKRWPEVCRVGKTLQELAPFILSEKDAPNITVENKKGEVFAKAFSDENGQIKILVAGIGPGNSEAVITLPHNINLKSRFGRTKQSAPGQYIFQGENISSDILE